VGEKAVCRAWQAAFVVLVVGFPALLM